MSRKIRSGACGICGAPQPAPSAEEVAKAMSRPDSGAGHSTVAIAWVSGHRYDNGDGRPHVLKEVRCLEHADEFDPRRRDSRSMMWGWGGTI